MTERYNIAEWFGEPFASMPPQRRQQLAIAATDKTRAPLCPFQRGEKQCKKKGGVCSMQRYQHREGRIDKPIDTPVIMCPKRFNQFDLTPKWLKDIGKFDKVFLAPEVPIMRSPTTGKPAGLIDFVVARDSTASQWFGLEIQAVYFSGKKMATDFERLLKDSDHPPPAPAELRRPDWRSSTKRLMAQLQTKAPTLNKWGTKLAVAVDQPFFQAIGGKSEAASQDLNRGCIIWLVPQISRGFQLERFHWEVMSLEDSSVKLISAEDTIKQEEFEAVLRTKLQVL